MKLLTFISLMLFSFSQYNMAQEPVETPKPNSMSNAVGLTAEGGVTLGLTDYKTNKVNYMGKLSLEYYIPSTGQGNIGIRIFGQTGFISGKDSRPLFHNPTPEFSTRLDLYGGGIFYTLSIDDAVYPWVAVGASNLWFFPKDHNENYLPNYSAGNYTNHILAYNGDAGVRIMVSKSISVNFTGGIIVASKDYLDDMKTGSNNDMVYTLTAGLSYFFGRDKDSDSDGVPDSRDVCPDTPTGVKVDENGCPLDADGDGVPDYLDKCPNTPSGVKVDLSGCPLDTDGDGVPDYLDKCSDTPSGVKVDENGCPLDADGDGVPDYLDKCPNTPSGAKVDTKGCPLDSDGDGVPDYLDKCPNTPKGVQVDAAGCPVKKEIVKVKSETIVLSGDTNFEFNKSKLLPNAYPVLDTLVNTMKGHPAYKWEVGGYTDGVGSAKYNIKLSKQRAQAIATYFVSKGVAKKSLKIVGYGKENPIATNETLEGRSMNRRVEIKLLSKE